MNTKDSEILQALRTAMEAELTGHAFYKNASRSTRDPKGKKTFERMAEEEMAHFNYLRHQYQSMAKNGTYDFSEKLLKRQAKHASSAIFGDEIKRGIKDAHFEVSALTIGMKLEMEAMRFYRECAEKAENEEVKNFYTQLADWEKDHYEAFQQQLQVLKEEYFQANNFVPM